MLEAAGDGDVELARQVGEVLVAEEDALELPRDRRGVEQLARREPRRRAADDAADIVHSRLEARQPGSLEALMMSGTRSIVTQRSWSCWRVVMSAMVRPDSRVSRLRSRTCVDVTTPLGMRTRIMAWPGVGRRMKTPAHLRRSLSSSPIVFQPSRAKRTRSSWISSPSFSALSASILFTAGIPPASAAARRRPSAPAASTAGRARRASGCWRPCRSPTAGPSGRAGSRCPRGSSR